jgi:toxin secretion/phage lysis holin
MDRIFYIIRGFSSLVGAAFVYMYGKMDQLLYTLVAFIILDYVTGIIKACMDKKLSSSVGFKGIMKKILILLLVAAGNLIDRVTGSGGVIRSVVCVFFLCNEALSIVENAALMGVPFPKKIKKLLEQLRDENDEGSENDGCSNDI